MLNMHKLNIVLVSGFMLIFSIHCFSQPFDKKLFIAIDGFAPAIKFGIEKNTSERFSLKASAGFCLVGLSLLSYNFYGSYRITQADKKLGLNLNIGFLDNYIEVVTPMMSLGFGGGASIYYRFQNRSTLSFRLGMITGPSIDNKEFMMLTLPNFGIEYALLLNKNSNKNK